MMPTKKAADKTYPKKEAQQRFEAALRGSRNVGPTPMKEMKRSKAQRDKDPIPKDDPEALISWGKRNIQNE